MEEEVGGLQCFGNRVPIKEDLRSIGIMYEYPTAANAISDELTLCLKPSCMRWCHVTQPRGPKASH